MNRLLLEPPAIGIIALPFLVMLAALTAVSYLRRGRRPSRPASRVAIAFTGIGLLSAVIAATWHLDPPTRRAVWLILLAGFMLARAIGGYRQPGGGVPRGVRFTLGMLRTLAVLTVLAILLRPVLTWTRTRVVKPTLAVLLDASNSMQIHDVAGEDDVAPLSRSAAVREAIAKNWKRLGSLSDQFDIVPYAFSGTLRPLASASRPATSPPGPWNVGADGEYTAIGNALAQLAEQSELTDVPLGAVLLISDGTDNLPTVVAPEAAAQSLAKAGVPILAVGVGSREPRGDTRAVLIHNLHAPEQVAVGSVVPIDVRLELLGLQEVPVNVECFWDEELVETKTLRPAASREAARLGFEYTSRLPGFHTIEVRVTPKDPSWNDGPVRASRFIRTIANQIQILYLEAHPRSEAAFLARALASEERFLLTRVWLTRPETDGRPAPLPENIDAWRTYHVIVLGNLRRSDLSARQIENIRELVSSQGTGLAVIGGWDASANENLSGALVDVLPVGASSGKAIETPVRVMPTPAGRGHPICRIGPEGQSLAAWDRLPALPGAALLGAPKPTAEVLAVDEQTRPMLVAATVGKGRSLALAFDCSWRWAMQSDEGVEAHRRFWRQIMFWLANRQPRVHITVDRPNYDLAEIGPGTLGVLVEAFVVDGLSGLPVEKAEIEATLTPPDGKRAPLILNAAPDRWTQRIHPTQPGTYALHLSAKKEGQLFGESDARFVVESIDRERRDLLANPALLQSLAAATAEAGGRYLELPELPELLKSLRKGDYRRQRTETLREDLTDKWRWPLLATFCGLLALEWIIRKRHGLV